MLNNLGVLPVSVGWGERISGREPHVDIMGEMEAHCWSSKRQLFDSMTISSLLGHTQAYICSAFSETSPASPTEVLVKFAK